MYCEVHLAPESISLSYTAEYKTHSARVHLNVETYNVLIVCFCLLVHGCATLHVHFGMGKYAVFMCEGNISR